MNTVDKLSVTVRRVSDICISYGNPAYPVNKKYGRGGMKSRAVGESVYLQVK